MSKLDDFLGLTNVSEIREEIKVNLGGKELTLSVRPITEEEHTSWQKMCNNISKNKVTFDTKKYNELILQNCIVEPDFSNAEFLDKVKCVDSLDFLNKKFPSGVISNITEGIQKLSGFESYEMEIETAKN